MNNIWASIQGVGVKILLAVSLILVGLMLYNQKRLEIKEKDLALITEKHERSQKDVENLNKQILILQKSLKEADTAQKQLDAKIKDLDSKKSSYDKELKEIKDANEKTRNLLNTKLPDDFKRLLNDAVAK